jgi:pimeloyl-ACP methyl ester carboxylesterase
MQTNYFQRPEGTLAYTDYGGSGQTVLMFPGMGALRSEYRFLAPILSRAGFRPVSVDLRGHGESSVPWTTYDVPSVGEDIIALIEHLDAGAVHVIGTSFSAAPAVWAAVERPDQIRSIVLIGAFVRDAKINPIMKLLFWLMMNNPWRVRTWSMYYPTLYPTHKPPDFQDYLNQLARNLALPGRFEAANALANSSRQPSAERLGKIKIPTLVLMGTKDPDFPNPAEEGRLIAEESGGRLELIEAAGHYPQTEMPEKTSSIVLEFLNQPG